MLSGTTFSAAAIDGSAVFRIVVSSDSMKNATATSHGSMRLTLSLGTGACGEGCCFVGEAVAVAVIAAGTLLVFSRLGHARQFVHDVQTRRDRERT